MNFLVHISVELPRDMDPGQRDRLLAAESERGLELMRTGKLVEIWRVPGRFANVSLYEATDATDLHELLTSLPLWPWLSIDVQPLARHPLTARRDDERR